MQWNIPELCFCSNNTLTLQFCSPFSTLHYSRSFYIALCTLHFALCTLHFAFCTLHCSRYFCNILGTLHLFQTLLYPSYYFALFQNTLVYPLYYILLYLKHSYVSVRHRRKTTNPIPPSWSAQAWIYRSFGRHTTKQGRLAKRTFISLSLWCLCLLIP